MTTPGNVPSTSGIATCARITVASAMVNSAAFCAALPLVAAGTKAPALSFILGQTQGLQQALDLLGIKATTVQQVDELLTENSFLLAAG